MIVLNNAKFVYAILALMKIFFFHLVNVKALANMFILNVLNNGLRAKFQENKWVLPRLIVGKKMNVKFVKHPYQKEYKKAKKI